MNDDVQLLWKLDPDALRWTKCAICNQQRLRIISEQQRPDFVFCDGCRAAYVLEKGGKLRMFYGQIPAHMTQTTTFALKQWRTYGDIAAKAVMERAGQEALPPQLKAGNSILDHAGSHYDALEALEAEKTEIFYERTKKTDPPPRALKQTGDLPNLDDLFKG